jgi:hypothetical protein
MNFIWEWIILPLVMVVTLFVIHGGGYILSGRSGSRTMQGYLRSRVALVAWCLYVAIAFASASTPVSRSQGGLEVCLLVSAAVGLTMGFIAWRIVPKLIRRSPGAG